MISLPPAVFITGTDTNVGKTVVAAVLLRLSNGTYWKPVQSGMVEGSDTDFVKAATGMTADHFAGEAYRLQQPLSPHAAARLDGVEIDLNNIEIPKVDHHPLIIEGAGGLLVPLNRDALIIDLIEKLDVPVIVVCRTQLGTINHTLLSINALRQRNIKLLGVVMNGEPNKGNEEAIKYYGKTEVLARIPPLQSCTPAEIAQAGSYFDLVNVK